MMVDPAALREALAGLAEKWDEYGGPYPDEAVIVAAARELLAGQKVTYCETHGVIVLVGDQVEPNCRMVEAVLTIPGDT